MSAMNRNPSRPPGPPQGRVQQDSYPHPSVPPQARAGPQRQQSRPTTRDPQPHSGLPRRPDQQQPVLQRQRSRPDQPYQAQPPPGQQQPPPRLQQLQAPRPDQYYQDQAPSQSQPMPDPYLYNELPMQPVAPAFVRAPSTPPQSDSQSSLYTPPPRPYAGNMLIRGNSDDDLDKSDAFWRRFNASVAQDLQPDAEKSSWLEKNKGKSSRYSRTIWIAGLIIILLAAAGIAIGVFLSFRNSSPSRPDTIGGAADITSAGATATAAAKGTTVGEAGVVTTSSLHVSPTNTVA